MEGGIGFAKLLVMVKQLNSALLFEQGVQTTGEVCLFLAITGNAG